MGQLIVTQLLKLIKFNYPTGAVEAVLSSLEDIRGLVDGPHGDPEFLSEILQNEQLQNLLSVSAVQTVSNHIQSGITTGFKADKVQC